MCFEIAASLSSHRAPAVVGKPTHQLHPARPIMEGTWVSSAKSGRIRAARLAFIACIVGGLLQKPLIEFAWDVQAFQTQLARVYEHISTRGGGAAFVGGHGHLVATYICNDGSGAGGGHGSDTRDGGDNLGQACIGTLAHEPPEDGIT